MKETLASRQSSEEQLRDYRRLQILFAITTLIGIICAGFILYFIIKYYAAQSTEVEPLRFVLFITAFIPAGITSILTFINCLALRYLKQLKNPNQKYLLPYLNIVLNSIPPFIIIAILIWAIFSI